MTCFVFCCVVNKCDIYNVKNTHWNRKSVCKFFPVMKTAKGQLQGRQFLTFAGIIVITKFMKHKLVVGTKFVLFLTSLPSSNVIFVLPVRILQFVQFYCLFFNFNVSCKTPNFTIVFCTSNVFSIHFHSTFATKSNGYPSAFIAAAWNLNRS